LHQPRAMRRSRRPGAMWPASLRDIISFACEVPFPASLPRACRKASRDTQAVQRFFSALGVQMRPWRVKLR
jgi:hypothetical protein